MILPQVSVPERDFDAVATFVFSLVILDCFATGYPFCDVGMIPQALTKTGLVNTICSVRCFSFIGLISIATLIMLCSILF